MAVSFLIALRFALNLAVWPAWPAVPSYAWNDYGMNSPKKAEEYYRTIANNKDELPVELVAIDFANGKKFVGSIGCACFAVRANIALLM